MSREYELQEAIRKAVSAADSIILEASDGSAEETDWLTAMVTGESAKKVIAANTRVYNAKQFVERRPDQP